MCASRPSCVPSFAWGRSTRPRNFRTTRCSASSKTPETPGPSAHCKGASLVAVEVKSGHETAQSGMAEFLRKHSQARRIVVGGASQGACTVEELLLDKVPLFGR